MTLLSPQSGSDYATRLPSNFVFRTPETPAEPILETAPVSQEPTPAELSTIRINRAREVAYAVLEMTTAPTAYEQGQSPIYDQMMYERLPDNADALELLEVFESLEQHRENRINEIIEMSRINIIKPRSYEMAMRIFKAGLTPPLFRKGKSREEVTKEFIDVESDIAAAKMPHDPEVTSRKLFFHRNDRRSDQVDFYLRQNSEKPEKNFTFWYSISPKEGVRKFVSYDARATQQEVPTGEDDILWLKMATELYQLTVVSHFKKHLDQPAGGKHRQ